IVHCLLNGFKRGPIYLRDGLAGATRGETLAPWQLDSHFWIERANVQPPANIYAPAHFPIWVCFRPGDQWIPFVIFDLFAHDLSDSAYPMILELDQDPVFFLNLFQFASGSPPSSIAFLSLATQIESPF